MAQQTITQEHLDRCHRVYDEANKQAFYQVESETQEGVEYEVRYNRSLKHLTCSCPAGVSGTPCKHRRWSLAHAAEVRAQQQRELQREQAEIDTWHEVNYERMTFAHPTRRDRMMSA